MRARALGLRGTFDIQSRHGIGTRIIVVVPRNGTRQGATR
jgi:signal transduction histidine kinase